MTRFAALLALFLLPASTLLFSDAPGAASRVAAVSTSGTGTVTGHVFHDVDSDGVYDEGELGLERLVQLVQDHTIVAEEFSASDGSYSMTDVPPGDYDLTTALSEQTRFCGEPGLHFFDPLALIGCSPLIDQPWHPTTGWRVPIVVASGVVTEVDFGGVPFDQSVLVGRAILEDDYAPPGTRVEAVVGDLVCGSTTVTPPGGFGFPVFMLVILGEGERDGCRKAGEPVGFLVGGIRASQSVPFRPQIEQTSPARFVQGLDAMTNAAWYWARQPSGQLPSAGAVATAVVGGVPCGQTTLESGQFDEPVTGFARLIVPSDSVQPGCGHPGAVVKFTIDGTASETALPWKPGLQRISLSLGHPTQSPAKNPTATSPAAASPRHLPEAGGPASGPRSGEASAVATVMMCVAGVLLAGAGLFLLKARQADKAQRT